MRYEIIVLPIDEVNRVGLSHCTNDRRYDEKRESLDREHHKEKAGKISCVKMPLPRSCSVFISQACLGPGFFSPTWVWFSLRHLYFDGISWSMASRLTTISGPHIPATGPLPPSTPRQSPVLSVGANSRVHSQYFRVKCS
jgi:hypothetical protein